MDNVESEIDILPNTEIMKIVGNVGNGKAPIIDGINIYLIKCGRELVKKKICEIIRQYNLGRRDNARRIE